MKTKYDWSKIQAFYDAGNSWWDIHREFGVANRAIQKAVKAGRLKTRSVSESMKIRFAKYGPNRMGSEARERLSKEQSVHNRGGKCKWFYVSGQAVQGTWERNLAQKLDEIGVRWTKLHTGKQWPYVIEGVVKHYTPDFHLPEQDVYLELKGYWWGNDREKMKAVFQQHTDKQLFVVEKNAYQRLLSCKTKDELLAVLV